MTDVLFQLQFVRHRLLPHFLFEYITLLDKRKIYQLKSYQPCTPTEHS